MKSNTSKIVLIITLIVSTFIYSSCKNDPCENVTCENAGTPTENDDACNCVCTLGYEGAKCETLSFSKYVLNKSFSESCKVTGNSTYSVQITSDTTDATKGKIKNLYNSGAFLNLVLNQDGNLSIPSQNIGTTGTISGKVYLGTTGKVEIEYYLAVGAAKDTCKLTY